MRTTLNHGHVNFAGSQSGFRANADTASIDASRAGTLPRWDPTANGEAVGDLGLLCARLEACGDRLDAQLDAIGRGNLSPRC